MSGVRATTSQRERMDAVLDGKRLDRLPLVGRLDMWYLAKKRTETLPEELREMTLHELHRAVGMGQEQMVLAFDVRLPGVELEERFEGEVVRREAHPVVHDFPVVHDLTHPDRPGVTTIELATPVGTLRSAHKLTVEAFEAGQRSYPIVHPLTGPCDIPIASWILDRLEIVPRFDRLRRWQERIGDHGYVLAQVPRAPFQQVLLDYLGEVETFYLVYDDPDRLRSLLDRLHERLLEMLHALDGAGVLLVEVPDNLTGQMTNPRLFAEYSLPHYQEYAEILHGQGKRLASHTDGELGPLLALLPESGIDVLESFSPAPLTQTTFDEVWDAIGGRDWPILWGGVPSPLLERRTPEAEFHAYLEHVLERVGDARIVFDVGDMVMGNNELERVRYLADRIERHGA